MASAISSSRSVSPPSSWLTRSMVTLFHEFDQSGWWFAFSAARATRVMKPNASEKSANSISRWKAPSTPAQPSGACGASAMGPVSPHPLVLAVGSLQFWRDPTAKTVGGWSVPGDDAVEVAGDEPAFDDLQPGGHVVGEPDHDVAPVGLHALDGVEHPGRQAGSDLLHPRPQRLGAGSTGDAHLEAIDLRGAQVADELVLGVERRLVHADPARLDRVHHVAPLP